MNPLVMALMLATAITAFGIAMRSRWKLLTITSDAVTAPRFDRLGQRLRITLIHAFGQKRMIRYPLPGLAHMAIFYGFFVLLLRIPTRSD